MDVPPHVRAFIEQRINSVEQIAVLVLLRADPARAWTVGEIARELRSTDTAITCRLDDLRLAGVIPSARDSDRVEYAPASQQMADLVSALADAYREQPTRVIELIYAKPPDAVLQFAAAFKLSKEKP